MKQSKNGNGTVAALNGLQQVLEALSAIVIYAAIYHIYTKGDVVPDWEIFSLILICIVPPLFNLAGAYRSWRGTSLMAEYRSVLLGCAMVAVALMSVGLATKSTHLHSRAVYALWLVLWPAWLILGRMIKRYFLRWIRSGGRNIKRAVIIGDAPVGHKLGSWICDNPWTGIRLVGYFSDSKTPSKGERILGSVEDALEYVKENSTDNVYLALPMREEDKIKNLTSVLSDSTASVFFVPDVTCFSLLLSGHTVYHDSIPAIALWDSPQIGLNLMLKQLMDYIIAGLMLLVLSPLMLVVAIAIKATSPGPVLFKQWRYGINGKPIKIYKFRSMGVCHGENGYVYNAVQKNDCRVTPVGKFIRKTSIDELPQLINVLEGKMSIVGPRPHVVAVNEEYRKIISGYMIRHKIKPGITGLAQVSGARGETDTIDKMEKRIDYDLEYIQNWSLALDLSIILKTPLNMMTERAY